MQKSGERYARKLSSDIDYRALSWMFKTLNNDDEFEHFFDALPSLCESEELVNAQRAFIKPNKKMLSRALIGMMDRTLLSELVLEEAKQRRIIICTKVIGTTSLLEPWLILPRVLFGDWIGFSRSIHFGLFVQSWKEISDPVAAFYAQYVAAVTLATVQERDDRWFELASWQLNESKSFLRSYYAIGDSILLVNAIFIIRRMIQTFCGSENHHQRDIDILKASSKTLELLCRFDIQNTSTEHQHVFCSLWNQLVETAEVTQNHTNSDVSPLCVMVLKSIRRLYVTLHENPGTLREYPNAHLAYSTPLHDVVSDVNPGIHLAASTPYRYGALDDVGSYTKCTISAHLYSYSTGVTQLPLDGLPKDARKVSMDTIRELTSMLIPYMPPTYSTPNPGFMSPVASSPFPTAIPTVTSHRPHPASLNHSVALGPYPLVPDPYIHPTAPANIPGVSPFVPSIQQMTSGRTGRRRDVSAAMAETDSQRDANVIHAPTPFTPKVPHRKRVEFVDVSSASNSRSSSPAVPARQEPPVVSTDADIPISTPARATKTPFIPTKELMPETPYVPPLPGPRQLSSVPQGTPAVTNTDLKKKKKKKKNKSPTPTKSPVELVPSSPSRDGDALHTSPVPSSSRGSIELPLQVNQPVSVGSSDTSIPIQVLLDTDSSHSATDASFATAPSASSSPVPFTAAITEGSSRGVPEQTPSTVPSAIEVDGYGEFSGLIHYSPHSVLYKDESYPTALHLFEARKFLPYRPDLAKRVRQCERVDQVTSISAELANFIRQDWGDIMISIVSSVFFFYLARRLRRGCCLTDANGRVYGCIDGEGAVP